MGVEETLAMMDRWDLVNQARGVVNWLAQPLLQRLNQLVDSGAAQIVLSPTEMRLFRMVMQTNSWDDKVTLPPEPPAGRVFVHRYDGVPVVEEVP